jgi:hypothetical protein
VGTLARELEGGGAAESGAGGADDDGFVGELEVHGKKA